MLQIFLNLAFQHLHCLQKSLKFYFLNILFVHLHYLLCILKYINNSNEAEGRIEFFDEEIGELPISKTSDDIKDIKNSVYSPSAASERKIQIIAISQLR